MWKKEIFIGGETKRLVARRLTLKIFKEVLQKERKLVKKKIQTAHAAQYQ